jgi:hypothetical protein
MFRSGWFHWHNIMLVLLIAAIATDLVFGLDAVLNAVSIFVVASLALAVLAPLTFSLAAIVWLSIRDEIEEIKLERANHLAWRWRILAYAGALGILADGLVGAWNVYQRHILFSTAVEAIPFSGVPVFLALASFPVRWIESWILRRRKSPASPIDAVS